MIRTIQPTLSVEELFTNFSHILHHQSYKIGDLVALIDIRVWLDRKYGKKTWMLQEYSPLPSLLAPFIDLPDEYPEGVTWTTVEELTEDVFTNAKAALFDEGHLWIWNDIFQRIGHRIPFKPLTSNCRYDVVFAPLLSVNYSWKRTMHPAFVEELAAYFSQQSWSSVIVIPDDPNLHDFRALTRIPNVHLLRAPLVDVIDMIGNASVFIGGDTGLSHIAGHFPNTYTISLCGEEIFTESREREFDHCKEFREHIYSITGMEGEYNSFPNHFQGKHIFFKDYCGTKEEINRVMQEITSSLQPVLFQRFQSILSNLGTVFHQSTLSNV